MTRKLSLNEVDDLIQTMKHKLDKCGYATKVVSRENYEAVLVCLSDEKELMNNHDIKVRLIFQEGILTVRLRKKKE